ncbi:hypothetical protein HDU96_010003 [Phlyctochytrium bullatum]|nr:hypothetical protein HDU96_010003 [Phlyctochytrium bullatum]
MASLRHPSDKQPRHPTSGDAHPRASSLAHAPVPPEIAGAYSHTLHDAEEPGAGLQDTFFGITSDTADVISALASMQPNSLGNHLAPAVTSVPPIAVTSMAHPFAPAFEAPLNGGKLIPAAPLGPEAVDASWIGSLLQTIPDAGSVPTWMPAALDDDPGFFPPLQLPATTAGLALEFANLDPLSTVGEPAAGLQPAQGYRFPAAPMPLQNFTGDASLRAQHSSLEAVFPIFPPTPTSEVILPTDIGYAASDSYESFSQPPPSTSIPTPPLNMLPAPPSKPLVHEHHNVRSSSSTGTKASVAPPYKQPLPPTPPTPTRSPPANPLPAVHLSKSSISKPLPCRTCASSLGILIFYGSPRELQDPVGIDVVCSPCAVAAGMLPAASRSPGVDEAGVQMPRKRRLKGVGRDMVIVCEACNRRMGFGGVRAGGKDGATERGEWQEPRASVEPICEWCVKNFDFCTQCGGGGTYRTGKWRPRQLFSGKRKTCLLAHDRLGAIAHFRVTTYRGPVAPIEDAAGRLIDPDFDPAPIVVRTDPVLEAHVAKHAVAPPPDEPRAAVLVRRREEFLKSNADRLLTVWATPPTMANMELLGTWDRLNAFVRSRQRELRVLMGQPPSVAMRDTLPEAPGQTPNPLNDADERQFRDVAARDNRRYLAVTDALRPRKDLLALSDAADPADPAAAAPTFVVGYFFLQWNVADRHLHLQHVRYEGKDSVDDAGPSPLQLMAGSLAHRIAHDARVHGLPEPRHVWCLGYKSATDVEVRTRFVLQIEKFGYRPLEEYCRRWGGDPEELRRVFVPPTLPGEVVEECEVWACRWEDLKAAAGLT